MQPSPVRIFLGALTISGLVATAGVTLPMSKDGEAKTLPARYSFTFVKEGENWLIVDHHSSAMPALPR